MVTGSPGVSRDEDTYTVASVGPYTSTCLAEVYFAVSSTSLALLASPASSSSFTFFTAARNSSLPRHICSWDGVICMVVAPEDARRWAMRQGSVRSSSSVITTVRPMDSGSNPSARKISKVILVTHITLPLSEARIRPMERQ